MCKWNGYTSISIHNYYQVWWNSTNSFTGCQKIGCVWSNPQSFQLQNYRVSQCSKKGFSVQKTTRRVPASAYSLTKQSPLKLKFITWSPPSNHINFLTFSQKLNATHTHEPKISATHWQQLILPNNASVLKQAKERLSPRNQSSELIKQNASNFAR